MADGSDDEVGGLECIEVVEGRPPLGFLPANVKRAPHQGALGPKEALEGHGGEG